MSSVAVLTQESFAEHRSGLKDVEITGRVPEDEAYIPTYLEAFPPLPDKGTPGEKTGEPAGAWSKIRPIKASVITQVFHVPLEERRYKDNSQFGEGEEAKVCLDIMQKTGAHIELSLAKDQGLSIMVTGKLDSVMKARKEIVAQLQTQASATVLIPKEHHRFVIGKNGEKLQELELKTATKIAIPRSDDPNANIRITGTKDGIEKARHEIQLISAEQDKRAVERLSFEKAFHPFIAGAYNQLVQEVSQETGARISIPPPSVPKDEIVITGEKEAVATAIARIRAIYEDKKRKTTTISVEVKKSQHKYIVGPKGNTLQEILENTGVSVEMPPLDSASETIILRGEPDKLGPALTQVYAKAKSVIVVEVIAPAWLHRFIIGKKGQNISRITQQLPKVHIEFTDGEECISLEGPTEEVEQAQAQLQEIIKDLMARMDYAEINIDHRFHRHLIGKNGANINRIKEQYKVSVRIPQDSEHCGLVRIEGDPQGVQLARKELMDMAQRMENERTKDLIIEHKFHRTIIGQKGEKIKEVRDKFPEVIIIFPDQQQKSDIVQLRGPKNEVEKCAKFLQKLIAELVESSFSISVPIHKQFHKNIIGKGGANIKKIREETNTKIDLPTENSNSEMIVITGKKSSCEAARDRILAIQNELANLKEAEVSIPAKLHNSLIGSKGSLVRSVMEECGGVHIHFPAEGSGLDKVTIRGPAEEVERARRQLLQLAEEKQVNNFSVELQAKPEYHKFLIGKGGANIRRVRDRTGARIIFPSPDEPEQEHITIMGKEEAVWLAQKELETLIQNLDDVIEDSMVVDPRHHRHFVCRRGQVLRELAEEYGGVAVSFPRTGTQSDNITLKGPRECVDAAKKRIQEIVQDLESQVNVEVLIPQRYHRAVMGPKGCKIQQITREHEVLIKFPDRDECAAQEPASPENGDTDLIPRKCDIIIVTGQAEKCELARAALLALVPVTIDVEVSYDLHRYIIGQKGAGIRKMMEDYENVFLKTTITSVFRAVSFPRTGTQSDNITLKGPRECVDAAKKRIQEIVQDLESQVNVEVLIPQRYHRAVMGPKGCKIQQITREHEVLIKFPDRDECAAQEPASPENGDTDLIPRKCDIIIVTGQAEKCELARAALLALVPVTIDVEVSYDLHRYIIGQKGAGIRKMMEDYEVNIWVPQPEQQSDIIKITGQVANVERAKQGLLERVKELQAEQEDRALRSYKVTLSVDPKYHPKIIGRKGAVISQIRKDYDVNVQFPDKGEEQQDVIVISGYERNANEARAAIVQLVAALQDMVSEDIRLDRRVHARIIGARGKAIRKLMEEFKVDIRFPQPGSEDPSKVTVTGLPENVDNATDHLLNLEEEYMLSVTETETMASYMKPPSKTMGTGGNDEDNKALAKGFVVRDAPWNAQGNKAPDMSSAEEFPTFGSGIAPKQTSAWGPKKC
ncbi:vigilin-like [Sinocyclocheilus anshuiensis]|uniref:vigilin-like n=1 Tax=Sinocyclocheilus anshuiensis TaxID=1608454 RepID=UPI0007B98613|nr:PREDICTED: vigilin-like [Sinocyclocheilus anshuiensis]